MKLHNISFLSSLTELKQLPATNIPEFAFIGRSNVGKSSLINFLAGRDIAKTSSTPGKTQTINHFLVNEEYYWVDLPGYGYAKLSKAQREAFEKMIHQYFTKRENLLSTFVLVDSRHKPLKNDLEFIDFLGSSSVPFIIIMTKFDKLNQKEKRETLEHYQDKLAETWDTIPKIIPTSSLYKIGREEVLDYMDYCLPFFKQS